jgi:CRISPR-associated protein Cmr6
LLLCDGRSWELTKQTKERFTKQIKGRKVLNFAPPELERLLREHRKRWEAMLDDCQQRGYEVKRFSLHAASRVVVGLGAESVLETSVRLHRVYGFPIIPASALKGLARSYALWQVAEQLGVPALSLGDLAAMEKAGQPTPIQRLEKYFDAPDENRRAQLFEELKRDKAVPSTAAVCHVELPAVEEKVKSLRAAFGTTGSAGKVIFFDAVPANPAKLVLELDVMNPHYSQYYQGSNTPPADYLNPVPVFFLAIAAGSEFLFAVASKDNSLAEKAQMLLQAALCEMGVGAKTAAGYGLWR